MANTYKEFRKIFNEIEKDRITVSRSRLRQRTEFDRDKLLTIGILEDLANLGDSYTYTYKGVTYTVSKDELRKLREKAKKKYEGLKDKQGVTFTQLLQKTDSDTKIHSKNEIKNAHLASIRGDILIILTDKTSKSTWRMPSHRVTVELKEFDFWANESPSAKKSYRKNAENACKGKVGVFCDCEDFQYRRNYWVTQLYAFVTQSKDMTTRKRFSIFGGNETISNTPKETGFPKITHATGEKGPLCIHLVRAREELKKPIVINRVAQEMVKMANSVEPGANPGKFTIDEDLFREAEKKIGKEKLKRAADAYTDKKAREAYEPFKNAVKSFTRGIKLMLSKERGTKEKAQKVNKAFVDHLLKTESIKRVAEISGLSEKEVREIAGNKK